MPKLGTRKIYLEFKKRELELSFKIGRDGLFSILKTNGMLIKRRKKQTITTNSNHPFKKYKNLIKNLEVNRKNQVLVSDITYIKTKEKSVYLSLITDLYSRKIIGYHLNKDLTSYGNIQSLKMALRSIGKNDNVIHHSDRGIQYCSHDYIRILKDNNIIPSMTEDNHVYENAVAERVNGILKGEFQIDNEFESFEEAEQRISEVIEIYNSKRSHMSINYMTPSEKYAA
jgi:putative transposase